MTTATWRRHPSLTSPPVPLDRLVAHFHDGSGETHLLTDATSSVLQALAADRLTLAELAARCGSAEADVAASLLDLLDAGLVTDTGVTGG